MYCKFCGKLIEEDSLFCRYCGKSIEAHADIKQEPLFPIVETIGRFQKFPLKTQIILTSYFVYLLILICCWSYDALYGEEFLLYGIVIPLILTLFLYFGRMWRTARKEEQQRKKPSQKTFVETEFSSIETRQYIEEEDGIPLKTEMLLAFAKSHGKMQVVKQIDSVTGVAEHWCVFEPIDGIAIKVSFAKTLGVLTAEEISKRKDELCINQYKGDIYELDTIDY